MLDKKLYKETYAALHAPEDTFKEVLKMTTQNSKQAKRRFPKVIPIAAALALALSTTTFAYVGFTQYENPGAMLNAFFGANSYMDVDESEHYDKYGNYYHSPSFGRSDLDEKVAADLFQDVSGTPLSLQYGDYTLTVEATLYDAQTNCALLYYKLENPNGVTGYKLQYDGELLFDPETISVSVTTSSAEATYIDETQTTDTALYACAYIIRGTDITENEEIEIFDYETNNTVKGSIALSAAQNMDSVTLKDGQIILSPIAIKLNADFANQFDGMAEIGMINTIVLHYADGSTYVVENDPDGANATAGAEWIQNWAYSLGGMDDSATFMFNRLVDVDNVVSVTINDTTYPVAS